MTSLTIHLPLPPRATHPNSRPHWASKAKAAKKQRDDACLAARAALSHAGFKKPKWAKASIQVTFYKPSNRAKAGDQDGCIAWLKPSCDGLQDAGVIDDDSGFVWLPPIQKIGREAEGVSGVEVVVTPIP